MKYCNASLRSTAIMALPCLPAVFKWEPTSVGKKDVRIYSPNNLNSPILSLNGIQEIPYSRYWFPDTDLWIPQLSALRLWSMGGITPIIDGYNADGSPKIVQHVVFDADFGGPAAFAWFDSVTGPAAANMTGWILPLGLKMRHPHWLRVGFPYLSPFQDSW